jgi:hypothetical protein
MKPNDRTDVSWKLLAALSCAEVGLRILAVNLNNEVAIIHVSFWVLVRKLVAKELRKSLHFDLMNGREIEPLATRRDDEGLLLVFLFHLAYFTHLLHMLLLLMILNNLVFVSLNLLFPSNYNLSEIFILLLSFETTCLQRARYGCV